MPFACECFFFIVLLAMFFLSSASGRMSLEFNAGTLAIVGNKETPNCNEAIVLQINGIANGQCDGGLIICYQSRFAQVGLYRHGVKVEGEQGNKMLKGARRFQLDNNKNNVNSSNPVNFCAKNQTKGKMVASADKNWILLKPKLNGVVPRSEVQLELSVARNGNIRSNASIVNGSGIELKRKKIDNKDKDNINGLMANGALLGEYVADGDAQVAMLFLLMDMLPPADKDNLINVEWAQLDGKKCEWTLVNGTVDNTESTQSGLMTTTTTTKPRKYRGEAEMLMVQFVLDKHMVLFKGRILMDYAKMVRMEICLNERTCKSEGDGIILMSLEFNFTETSNESTCQIKSFQNGTWVGDAQNCTNPLMPGEEFGLIVKFVNEKKKIQVLNATDLAQLMEFDMRVEIMPSGWKDQLFVRMEGDIEQREDATQSFIRLFQVQKFHYYSGFISEGKVNKTYPSYFFEISGKTLKTTKKLVIDFTSWYKQRGYVLVFCKLELDFDKPTDGLLLYVRIDSSTYEVHNKTNNPLRRDEEFSIRVDIFDEWGDVQFDINGYKISIGPQDYYIDGNRIQIDGEILLYNLDGPNKLTSQ